MVEFIQYVRGGNRRRRGVFVASVNPETKNYQVGWSLCNKKDRFNRDTAISLAKERMTNGGKIEMDDNSIPYTIRKEYRTVIQNRIDRINNPKPKASNISFIDNMFGRFFKKG